MTIRKATVIGAGVMGAGIAAQFANAGVPVLLLEVVPAGATERNALAAGALTRMLKAVPAPFMSAQAAKLLIPGNVEDDLARVADSDWIVEAVVERLDVKQALDRKLEAVRRPGTAVTSNTSTIPLARLVDGLPESRACDFFITHLFNPPRYMRLLELVTGPKTDRALAKRVARARRPQSLRKLARFQSFARKTHEWVEKQQALVGSMRERGELIPRHAPQPREG